MSKCIRWEKKVAVFRTVSSDYLHDILILVVHTSLSSSKGRVQSTKQSINIARNKYILFGAILFGYLDSWLFCTVKNPV